MKILKEKYKTQDGARKRCQFENGIAGSEFRNGHKAAHYHYTVVQVGDCWRVAREGRRLLPDAWIDPRNTREG